MKASLRTRENEKRSPVSDERRWFRRGVELHVELVSNGNPKNDERVLASRRWIALPGKEAFEATN